MDSRIDKKRVFCEKITNFNSIATAYRGIYRLANF